MGSLLSRYRNLTLLLLLLLAQLILVAYQVRTGQDVRLLRVWAVSAVTPLARLVASTTGGASGLIRDYVVLWGARQESQRLKEELDRLKMENRFLRSELGTAERAQALGAFQARTPSRTVAARVIGAGPTTDSRVLLLDRGASSGVRPGMAVINAEGIVGKVTVSFPTASQVLLITDRGFAAGVISGVFRIEGTLRGVSRSLCRVDYLQNEEKVQVGEWFYTSGEDRLFPRGLPVGQVQSATPGKTFQEVLVAPSALSRGLEEVLIVLEGVHQGLPAAQEALPSAPLLPQPPSDEAVPATPEPTEGAAAPGTDADRLVDRYRKTSEAQKRPYGDNVLSAKPPSTPPPGPPAPVKP
ncbi:MAG TPA: rod shape-determining protein MreC [Bryobacteraceae bacterium]|nr:rod shape-determining protein MreC [Bryobacteraceae bacterium]